MKFKFCGDADAPDWVLGEMATISKISSVRVKLLLGQIVKGQLSGAVDYEKLAKVRTPPEPQALRSVGSNPNPGRGMHRWAAPATWRWWTWRHQSRRFTIFSPTRQSSTS
jgi:hypothetical protein